MPKTATVKDIEAQIKKLEHEKTMLENAARIEDLKEIINTTPLSVAQIKKAIKDAEKSLKITKAKKSVSNPKKTSTKANKIASKPKNPNAKPKFSKVIACNECGKEFESHSPRQVICPECKSKKK